MDNAYKMLEPGDEPVCDQVCGSYADEINKEAAFGGTISLSLSHWGQNMYQKKAPAVFMPVGASCLGTTSALRLLSSRALSSKAIDTKIVGDPFEVKE